MKCLFSVTLILNLRGTEGSPGTDVACLGAAEEHCCPMALNLHVPRNGTVPQSQGRGQDLPVPLAKYC